MTFHLLHLKSYPIYQQLLLEEALLRGDNGNWCIINEGTPPAIVMGISGKKEELIDCSKASQDGIPLIKRFSGGGTVIVDEHTLFVTFICQKNLHPFPPYPEPIMKWTEAFYRDVFRHPDFHLRENDYVLADKKCGGNAQYIKKDRWLHHTSFLWNYLPQRMEYLLHPKKAPSYRAGRPHTDFLCRLADHYDHPQEILERIQQEIEKRYSLKHCYLEEAIAKTDPANRQSTLLL